MSDGAVDGGLNGMGVRGGTTGDNDGDVDKGRFGGDPGSELGRASTKATVADAPPPSSPSASGAKNGTTAATAAIARVEIPQSSPSSPRKRTHLSPRSGEAALARARSAIEGRRRSRMVARAKAEAAMARPWAKAAGASLSPGASPIASPGASPKASRVEATLSGTPSTTHGPRPAKAEAAMSRPGAKAAGGSLSPVVSPVASPRASPRTSRVKAVLSGTSSTTPAPPTTAADTGTLPSEAGANAAGTLFPEAEAAAELTTLTSPAPKTASSPSPEAGADAGASAALLSPRSRAAAILSSASSPSSPRSGGRRAAKLTLSPKARAYAIISGTSSSEPKPKPLPSSPRRRERVLKTPEEATTGGGGDGQEDGESSVFGEEITGDAGGEEARAAVPVEEGGTGANGGEGGADRSVSGGDDASDGSGSSDGEGEGGGGGAFVFDSAGADARHAAAAAYLRSLDDRNDDDGNNSGNDNNDINDDDVHDNIHDDGNDIHDDGNVIDNINVDSDDDDDDEGEGADAARTVEEGEGGVRHEDGATPDGDSDADGATARAETSVRRVSVAAALSGGFGGNVAAVGLGGDDTTATLAVAGDGRSRDDDDGCEDDVSIAPRQGEGEEPEGCAAAEEGEPTETTACPLAAATAAVGARFSFYAPAASTSLADDDEVDAGEDGCDRPASLDIDDDGGEGDEPSRSLLGDFDPFADADDGIGGGEGENGPLDAFLYRRPLRKRLEGQKDGIADEDEEVDDRRVGAGENYSGPPTLSGDAIPAPTPPPPQLLPPHSLSLNGTGTVITGFSDTFSDDLSTYPSSSYYDCGETIDIVETEDGDDDDETEADSGSWRSRSRPSPPSRKGSSHPDRQSTDGAVVAKEGLAPRERGGSEEEEDDDDEYEDGSGYPSSVVVAVGRRTANDRRLTFFVALSTLGGFFASLYVQITCHFVTSVSEVGSLGRNDDGSDVTFALRLGLWKYTPVDSAFAGYTYCLDYDAGYFEYDPPLLPRALGLAGLALGSCALYVAWTYLLLGVVAGGSRRPWAAGQWSALTASACQGAAVVTVFEVDMCRNGESACAMGPGAWTSLGAAFAWLFLAVDMGIDMPTDARNSGGAHVPMAGSGAVLLERRGAGFRAGAVRGGAVRLWRRAVMGRSHDWEGAPSLSRVAMERQKERIGRDGCDDGDIGGYYGDVDVNVGGGGSGGGRHGNYRPPGTRPIV